MRLCIAGFCLIVLGVSTLAFARQPSTQPADQSDPADKTDPFAGVDGGIIRLPDGREVNLADLQGGGMTGVMVMKSIGTGEGTTVMVTDEQGRKIRIREGDDEIVVTITEADKDPVEYKAQSVDELKEKHPEAFELYERFAKPDFAGAIQHLPPGAFGDRFHFRVGGGLEARLGREVEALGATCRPVLDEFVKSQLGAGVVVFRIPADSLGATLGLQKHDLIKSVNDKPVETIEQLEEALETADKLKIQVIRGGKQVTVEEQ